LARDPRSLPNHLHGILAIGDRQTLTGGAGHDRPDRRHDLGTIIRVFKSAVMKRINEVQGTPGASLWQRGYHDHVMRDAADLAQFRKYIADNPARWPTDEENPAR
jgi:REP element-mobilizing transposase RayT